VTEAPNAAREIPREAWPLHPNWPDHVLLVRSHESFRLVSERLRAEVRRLGRLSYSARLFRRWMYAMGNHEHYEEHKLYPYLERRWGVSMAALTAGHAEMHTQRHEVEGAFGAAEKAPDDDVEARARVREAIDRFDALLLAHLDLEERMVVPLLLELSPREFADYTLLPIERLLAKLDAGASSLS